MRWLMDMPCSCCGSIQQHVMVAAKVAYQMVIDRDIVRCPMPEGGPFRRASTVWVWSNRHAHLQHPFWPWDNSRAQGDRRRAVMLAGAPALGRPSPDARACLSTRRQKFNASARRRGLWAAQSHVLSARRGSGTGWWTGTNSAMPSDAAVCRLPSGFLSVENGSPRRWPGAHP